MINEIFRKNKKNYNIYTIENEIRVGTIKKIF